MITTTSSSIEIVHQFLEHMARGDYDSAMTLISDDCEYINPPPFGGVRGPSAVRAVLEPLFAPTLENEFKVLRETSAGPVVFVERLDRHHLADRWVELPVTGVFETRNGQITFWRDYFDAATFMGQWPAA